MSKLWVNLSISTVVILFCNCNTNKEIEVSKVSYEISFDKETESTKLTLKEGSVLFVDKEGFRFNQINTPLDRKLSFTNSEFYKLKLSDKEYLIGIIPLLSSSGSGSSNSYLFIYDVTDSKVVTSKESYYRYINDKSFFVIDCLVLE